MLLESMGVKHVKSSFWAPNKAFAAERLGLNLRLAIGRAREENPRLGIQELVTHFNTSYNDTVHR